MDIDLSQFINTFDIAFLIIVIISLFFGIKNGLVKSSFNLIKWFIIFYLIKNCFKLLRPIIDSYISNQTIADILIFFFTLIVSYILLSFIIRVIIGVLQPKKSGLVDISFGGVLGIIRGYIIFVLIIFFISSNVSTKLFTTLVNEGSFKDLIGYGVGILEQMPRNLENINDLEI